MGWNSQIVIASQVVIEGGGSDDGLFLYDGPAGAGDLMLSETGPGVTTDPYGNAVTSPGIVAYSSGGVPFMQLRPDKNALLMYGT